MQIPRFPKLAALLLTLGLTVTGAAHADWKTEWAATVAQAKGQTLNLLLQPDTGYQDVVAAFQKQYPDIKVKATLINPSDAGPRILTEQQNGIFAWDAWWGTASNMNNVVLPAGGLSPLKNYLILPEVTDPSNWRQPDYLYTNDKVPDVFVHTHFLMDLGVYNTNMVPGHKLTLDNLLDPSLKGKISIRVPNRPHGGSMMLAAIAKARGIGEVQKLLTDMAPRYVDNDRQNFMLVSRGGAAVALGVPETTYFDCKKDGGCQNLRLFPARFMHSRGVSVPKNPPHPAAAKVFVNWLLSRTGQTEYVKDWAKYNPSGAFSMRKDVAGDPSASQKASVPDFDHMDKYVAVSFDSGQAAVQQIIDLYNKLRGGQ